MRTTVILGSVLAASYILPAVVVGLAVGVVVAIVIALKALDKATQALELAEWQTGTVRLGVDATTQGIAEIVHNLEVDPDA